MHKTKDMARGFALRAALGPDHISEPDDILDTKYALMALGYYQAAEGSEPGAWVDSDLFAGIKSFQRHNGLKIDGLIRPGGPTEKALNATLEELPVLPANDDRPPANDNGPDVALVDCYHRYDVIDGNKCRALPAPDRRSRCWASAARRLAACTSGRSSPSLETW